MRASAEGPPPAPRRGRRRPPSAEPGRPVPRSPALPGGARSASRSCRRASRTRRRSLRPGPSRTSSAPPTVTAVRQPSCLVGIGADPGHPLGAVVPEAEEVRRRVELLRRRRPVDERDLGLPPRVLLERQALVPGQGPDQDVDSGLLDEPPRLCERAAGRAVRAAEDEANRAAADRDAVDPVGDRPGPRCRRARSAAAPPERTVSLYAERRTSPRSPRARRSRSSPRRAESAAFGRRRPRPRRAPAATCIGRSADRDPSPPPCSSRGSIRETVPSNEFATQTAPSPAAIAVDAASDPDRSPTTRFVAGSIRETVSSSRDVTQTPPRRGDRPGNERQAGSSRPPARVAGSSRQTVLLPRVAGDPDRPSPDRQAVEGEVGGDEASAVGRDRRSALLGEPTVKGVVDLAGDSSPRRRRTRRRSSRRRSGGCRCSARAASPCTVGVPVVASNAVRLCVGAVGDHRRPCRRPRYPSVAPCADDRAAPSRSSGSTTRDRPVGEVR